MRNRIFVIWAALRWVLLMFVLASTLHAPLVVALPKQPVLPLRVWKGTASWYGSRFHGRRTANGETYDMYAYTAAHPTLPFGSLVRLVNPRTGRSQLVRINDRGPFVDDREIDVSYGVARRLGMTEKGLARVRIELLEVPPRR
ncbi:MAG: hypothetical protein DMG28_14410 [Acidobacteria bacterium]|nr:MAG: hypothetical protein DMG28_14410 [Acidobacteriota bacterium]